MDGETVSNLLGVNDSTSGPNDLLMRGSSRVVLLFTLLLGMAVPAFAEVGDVTLRTDHPDYAGGRSISDDRRLRSIRDRRQKVVPGPRRLHSSFGYSNTNTI